MQVEKLKRSNASIDKVLKIFSYFICVGFAIYFTVQCIENFMLDNDVTQIEYRKFHYGINSIYPSVTYCIKNPISSRGVIWERYREKDPNQKKNQAREYRSYLAGFNTSVAFSEDDYDLISIKLEHYLNHVITILDSNIEVIWELKNGTFFPKSAKRQFKTEKGKIVEELTAEELDMISLMKFYITRRSIKEKCYTFDIPFIKNVQVNSFEIYLKIKVLFDSNDQKNTDMIQPKEYENSYSMYFHYPHQKLRAISSRQGFESSIDSTLQYTRQHFLRKIEVLRRRYKRSQPCITDYEYDEKITTETIKSFGCKIPNVDIQDNAPLCQGKEFLKFYTALFKKQHPPPCQVIQAIDIVNEERANEISKTIDPSKIPRKLIHKIHFDDDSFKEMIYMKDYTFLSLFANAGGYIGIRLKIEFQLYFFLSKINIMIYKTIIC